MRKSPDVVDKCTFGGSKQTPRGVLERLGASGERLRGVLERPGSVLGRLGAVLVAFKVVLDIKMSFESAPNPNTVFSAMPGAAGGGKVT